MNKVREERLVEVVAALAEKLGPASKKEQQRDVAALGLKTASVWLGSSVVRAGGQGWSVHEGCWGGSVQRHGQGNAMRGQRRRGRNRRMQVQLYLPPARLLTPRW